MNVLIRISCLLILACSCKGITPENEKVMAWYPARDRYRADSLIRYLGRFGSADTILIGLTNKDISTTKGQIRDWGIMGLGYCPGTSCVV